MTHTLYLDSETVSTIDLTLVGVRAYAEHPSTKVLCWSWALDDGPIQSWWPGDPLPVELTEAINAGCRVVAHNFGFDATLWDRHMVPLGWPAIPLDRWSCTAFRCRLARLPAGLEETAKVLGLPAKGTAGRKLVLSLSKRDLATKPLTEEEHAIADAYVKQDTALCRMIDLRLPEMPEEWRELFEFDHEMNERGMPIDIPAVEKLIIVRNAETSRLGVEFNKLTNGELTSPKQNKKFRAKLSALGVDLPNLQRETLEDWVEENPHRKDLATQLIHTALQWAHSSDAKLDRMIASAQSTGRARDLFVLHGAHTGRWAGRNVQPQNLPKNVLDAPEATLTRLLARADEIIAGTIDPMQDPGWSTSIKEAISGVLRPLIKAPEGWRIVSCDLGQIESRTLCWIAGQKDKLQAYREGRDVYTLEAKALDSDSRDLGKLFVLSAGYGASGRVMFIKAPGFNVILTEEETHELTARWRENNPNIVSFWYDLFRSLCFCLELPADQDPIEFRGLYIWRDDTTLFVQLPSGRCLKYRDPVLGLDDRGFPQITVSLPKNKKLLPVSIWHGSATENVVSGIAYDVLVEKMLQLHREGVFVIACIHDEVICVAPTEDAEAIRDRMVEIMSTPPEWATGLPLAAEGFINARFVRPAKPLHAQLAPSSAERWFNCPGSVAAVQALPPVSASVFAMEGTEAHRIFAHCLIHDLDPIQLTQDPLVLYPLRHALMIARDIIAGRRFKVEIRLDPLPGLSKVWGTADVLIFDEHDRVVAIIDLKFGAGIAVEPDALQLRIYALLSAQQYGCPMKGIDLHIVQPRRQQLSGLHRMHQISTDDLAHLFAQLQKAVQATEDPAPPRLAGSWCRFCPARQGCPEARATARAALRPLVNPFMAGGFR